MESKSYIKEQLLTTKIHINSSDIFNTQNIDSLIKFQLKKNLEGHCGKYGYVIPNSLVIIKRSVGTTLANSDSSKIEFNINYKIKVISPSVNDIYECIIDNITKMGILAYLKTDIPELNNIKDSPILIIIPQEYLNDNNIEDFKSGDIIQIIILDSRIKYHSKQIQTVAKIYNS